MARCFSGRRLREARIGAGLRPERLALLVERSVYSIHEYERGRARPTVGVLASIADVLNRPVDDFFADEVTADVA